MIERRRITGAQLRWRGGMPFLWTQALDAGVLGGGGGGTWKLEARQMSRRARMSVVAVVVLCFCWLESH
jgi:hypothetical protein